MSTYIDFINEIIIQHGQHRKDRPNPDGLILERHHIKPRCLGGTDDIFNLIDLTVREHYIAHKLLAEEYPEEEKLVCAWHFMSTIKNGRYQATPEEYAASREAIIRAQGEVVYQLDENGNVLAIYHSAREAARQIDTAPSHIIECCNKKRHRAKGYFWQYAKDFEEKGFSHKPFLSGKKPEKAVAQYTQEGKLVKTYPSIAAAARAVDRHDQAIRYCCNGKTKQSAGYIWRFIEN